MKKSRLLGAVCAVLFTFTTPSANATLVDNGGGLIYDTVLDITWAQPSARRNWDEVNAEDLTVIADAGYFKRVDILSCHESGITAFVPRSPNLGNRAKTAFGKKDFRYLPEKDEYRCPANERLIWRMTTEEAGLTVHRYWSANCQTCALKSQCTHGKERRVTRWEHEAILESMQDRLDCDPEIMRLRRQTVEHPYGTLNLWMGSAHFLTRTLN